MFKSPFAEAFTSVANLIIMKTQLCKEGKHETILIVMKSCINVSHERCINQTVSVVHTSTQSTYKCAARTGHEGKAGHSSQQFWKT